MYSDVKLFISGKWRDGFKSTSREVVNPSTQAVIGKVACAEASDLDEAIHSAEIGFEAWRNTSAFHRYGVLKKAADLIRERAKSIAELLTLEQGKPLEESMVEVLGAADLIDWYAEECRRAYGRLIPARSAGIMQSVRLEPVGIVAAFTPWNFPINVAVRKLAGALAAGCSIILKGPEETPASPAALVRAFADAGVTTGAVTLIFGDPGEIAQHLISHPAIAKISFTGSTAVGKKLAALAGAHMKRTTMELGGHAPVIVMDDVDPSSTAEILVAAKFRNAGQVCISPTRFLVHEKIAAQFTEEFLKRARKIRVGDGFDASTTMGPLANPRRTLAMERLVTDASLRGAEVALGGGRVTMGSNFFEPTVLLGPSIEADVMNEEPFGPIVPIVTFDDLEEAISEANRLPVGLAAYAFVRSGAAAERIATEVYTGMLSINHYALGLPETPFGGRGGSGHGFEGGAEALEGYFSSKFVTQRFI
ncbi:NAD-dependent succinate-semialdehyde dehydrogenase [Paraburkholderia sp. D1E]|uniref:NAD-dependent succinate-semialdehyde dehydrogenase n=1 Tax=Paraburkholderia sp. D1E TaxID=3461398 RepID=UPI004046131B